ncbi:MAG: L-2-amino-thiazoline-4-carboxylic acid hydrolase, partial [Enterocloster sp.]
MGFNEMTHAFLAARYYIRLTEQFGDRGREAFIHGIQYYGSQRGRRMAQRAIRDGKPLTYENYCRYGEWVNTEEIKAMGAANRVEIGGYDPDYIMNIYSCPWFAQFQKMGAGEAGKAYCSVLDA